MTETDQAYSEYFKTVETIAENKRIRQVDYGKWFDESMIKLLKKTNYEQRREV